MISFFKERDFLHNCSIIKKKRTKRDRQKKKFKKVVIFLQHTHIKESLILCAQKHYSFRGIIRRLLEMDGTLPFILSLFFRYSRFLSFNICFAS